MLKRKHMFITIAALLGLSLICALASVFLEQALADALLQVLGYILVLACLYFGIRDGLIQK